MSIADRHITSLMRQISTRNAIELVHPFAELQTFGALVYIAECYGFRYESVRLVGKQRILHVQLVRDPSPWARQRAAANSAAFPDPGPGRPVPGMYLGSLTPVPEAQPDVDLITALIRHDALGAAANRRQLQFIGWGSAVLFLLMAVLTGVYAVLLPLAVLMPAFMLGALRVNTSRRAKLAKQLTAAGCTPVRDAAGSERYVRPVPQGF
ncbi:MULTISPECIES: hypothetical protein [unclassified Streptomyces]|uniref:hypothetical protein n=1 Tax=unclassified Streptomyces TaxID=2593676 RepID=UPI00090C5EEA|nr:MULTISPECIES: hypothetical protein [unclassified Streptomyces]MDX3243032.1 hypothetical protein [Streptomyces sp. ME18-1-4]SHI04787.1 hypothetical protein SAMN05444521_3489 [Streptomyces sp. 3214.6]